MDRRHASKKVRKNDVTEGPDENLFFEVSKKVESMEMLQGWFEWFRGLNIPCAITKSREGYALWRQGEEVGRMRSKQRPELIKQRIVCSFGL